MNESNRPSIIKATSTVDITTHAIPTNTTNWQGLSRHGEPTISI